MPAAAPFPILISASGRASRHIADDDLELYSLHRLAEVTAAPVEEHPLVCEEYRERPAGWDEYVRAIRAAMRTIRPEGELNPFLWTLQDRKSERDRHELRSTVRDELGRVLEALNPRVSAAATSDKI